MAYSTDSDLVDKLNTAIEARISGGAVESYSIGSRDLRYIPLADLLSMRDELQARVNRATYGRVGLLRVARPS